MPIFPPLIVLVGPTACGKTDAAVRLAQALDAEIISCDSRQIYQGMAIGTAQPSSQQLACAPHHLIGHVAPDTDYNVHSFEQDFLAAMADIGQRSRPAILAGGSGLYCQAALEGIDLMPDIEPDIRLELQRRLLDEGLAPLVAQLQACDPLYCQTADLNNPRRVIRGLELWIQTGKPFSSFRSKHFQPRSFPILRLGLQMDRELLYQRINERCSAMFAEGWEAEARSLLPLRSCNALQTVGYRELFMYFDGLIDFAECQRLIMRNTRHYAKKQIAWFGRDPEIQWYDAHNFEAMLQQAALWLEKV